MWVRTRSFFPHPLPKGLAAGTEVEVIIADHDRCAVRDETGREWLVELVSLDPGHLVWVDGHWQADIEEKAS